MANYELLKEKFNERYALLLDIERVSEPLASAHAQQLIDIMGERTELFEKLRECDEQIKLACEKDAQALAAADNAAKRSELCEDAKVVFDLSLRCKAVANRLVSGGQLALEHIQKERDDIRDAIEALNENSGALALKYSQSVKGGVDAVKPGVSDTRKIRG